MKIINIGLIVVAIVIPVIVSGGSVDAQSLNGSIITTSPISVDLTAKPGSAATTTLQVENNSSKPITLSVHLEMFKAYGSNGQARIYKPPLYIPSLSWVHFSKTTFVALPNIWNSIKMAINLPKTAALGYYYAVLFVPNNKLHDRGNTTIKGANAILVLLDAQTSYSNDSLMVKSFQSNKKVYQYLPASFSVDVENTGNIYTIPQGDIYISRTLNGPTINTLPFNSAQGNILPKSNRVFQVIWQNGSPLYVFKRFHNQILSNKNGLPETELSWNFHNFSDFRIGKYYARLVLVYNNGIRDVPVQSVVSFWVLPWELILAFLVIIIIFVLGVWTLFKPFIKKIFGHSKSAPKINTRK